jgi:hypothetical protein
LLQGFFAFKLPGIKNNSPLKTTPYFRSIIMDVLHECPGYPLKILKAE